VKITLNGEEKQLAGKMSVENLVAELQLDTRKIAIERNLHIVPRSAYDSTVINDGDTIEIVHFIGGG
jgi:thiamine biosynthesis protein ThiS